jgi:hypothetical protein
MKIKIFLSLFVGLILSGCTSRPDLTNYTEVDFPKTYCEFKFTEIMVKNRRNTNKQTFANDCGDDEGRVCDEKLLEAVEIIANSSFRNSDIKYLLKTRDLWCLHNNK